MESNESRLARLETKVDYITKQVDKLVNTLECKDKECTSCKAEINSKINKVEQETGKLSTKVAIIIAAITTGGASVGTYITKLLGLI